MKLYYSPGACSLSPHIVALELGIDIALEKVDLRSKQTETGKDFLGVTPKGYVPALELDDGRVLTEGVAVTQYLADLKPDAGLAPPAGTFERAQLQEMLTYVNSEIHKSYSPLFNPAASDEVRERSKANLLRRYELIEQALAKHPYVLGDSFGVADAYLFTVTNWARPLGLDLSGFPALLDYQKRIGERPAVQAALAAERDTKKA